MSRFNNLRNKVAYEVANFDREHKTPEEIAKHKKLLKKFKRHIKNSK